MHSHVSACAQIDTQPDALWARASMKWCACVHACLICVRTKPERIQHVRVVAHATSEAALQEHVTSMNKSAKSTCITTNQVNPLELCVQNGMHCRPSYRRVLAPDDPFHDLVTLHLIDGRQEIHGRKPPVDARHPQVLCHSILCRSTQIYLLAECLYAAFCRTHAATNKHRIGVQGSREYQMYCASPAIRQCTCDGARPAAFFPPDLIPRQCSCWPGRLLEARRASLRNAIHCVSDDARPGRTTLE